MSLVRFLFTLFALFMSPLISAQRPTHVAWTTEVETDESGIGVIRWIAEIEPGWHIYGMVLPNLGDTPMPDATSFTILPTEDVAFVGDIEASASAKTHFDEVLKLNLPWWEGRVIFTRRFEVRSEKEKLTIGGTIKYMACSAQSCTPPTEEQFEVTFDNIQPAEEVIPVKSITARQSVQSDEKESDTIVADPQKVADDLTLFDKAKDYILFGGGFISGLLLAMMIGYFRLRKTKKQEK